MRDTGLKAGQKIINMYANSSIELLLPEVCTKDYPQIYHAEVLNLTEANLPIVYSSQGQSSLGV